LFTLLRIDILCSCKCKAFSAVVEIRNIFTSYISGQAQRSSDAVHATHGLSSPDLSGLTSVHQATS